jgi:hypothetical protein
LCIKRGGRAGPKGESVFREKFSEKR